MNDILKSKLEILAEDELTLKAIREVAYNNIESIAPDINKTDDDNILGQKFRASAEAIKLIEKTLKDIGSYKKQRSNNKQSNRGR